MVNKTAKKKNEMVKEVIDVIHEELQGVETIEIEKPKSQLGSALQSEAEADNITKVVDNMLSEKDLERKSLLNKPTQYAVYATFHEWTISENVPFTSSIIAKMYDKLLRLNVAKEGTFSKQLVEMAKSLMIAEQQRLEKENGALNFRN